jgi:hypothetical protein
LTTALIAVSWTFGVFPASAALEGVAAYLAINLGLYAVIRSGFNLRLADHILTRFQILVAITVVMYIVYHVDDGRDIALFGCFIVFLFGIFRLSAREFTVAGLPCARSIEFRSSSGSGDPTCFAFVPGNLPDLPA